MNVFIYINVLQVQITSVSPDSFSCFPFSFFSFGLITIISAGGDIQSIYAVRKENTVNNLTLTTAAVGLHSSESLNLTILTYFKI